MITKITEKIFQLFNVPKIAVRYFRLSNKLSGLNKNNFPKELVPLNTKQLTRGMLNYTFFQHYPEWKRPFWAVKQYDTDNISFIPRSHIGVSVNVTHRNWTAIGNLNCDIEPIVDPCGSVVSFIDGWSIECWVKYKDDLIIPAYSTEVKQRLINDLPIVETELYADNFNLRMISYTLNDNLVCNYDLISINQHPDLNPHPELKLLIAVRPFNCEGVSPVNSIEYDEKENSFIINDEHKVNFMFKPDEIILSNLNSGDSANLINDLTKKSKTNKINCKYGFANAIAVYKVKNIQQASFKVECIINLNNISVIGRIVPSINSVMDYWEDILKNGSAIKTPDNKLNSIIKGSLTTVLQFIDEDKVTPGAAIYHQFWFRDAAFQLNILDKLGYTKLTRKVYKQFFRYQRSDGYFQSQKGEWDSNGQVLWAIYNYALLSDDLSFLKDNFSSLYRAVKWIEKNRLKDKKYSSEKFYGLLPKGLSAEHLGLADNYYWDNFWAIAGIKAFIMICDIVNESEPKEYAINLYNDYENILIDSISKSVNSNEYAVLSSAPCKSLDSGMIGSLTAVYPLQILDWENDVFINSLEYIHKNHFHKNLFLQNIIHSGGNPYITLQTAHTYLYLGKRDLFNKIFNNVMEYCPPTLNFPEAIHPLTGGGVIGDGHHGWAAAEVLSCVRDVFVYESNYYSKDIIKLILLSGITKEWLQPKNELSIKNASVLSGIISIKMIMVDNTIEVNVEYQSNKIYNQEFLIIALPFVVSSISSTKKELSFSNQNGESLITFKAESINVKFII